jgi:polyribonucleotide nucleotidyltransferase
MKVVDQETGEDITEKVKAMRDAERGSEGGDEDRPPRRDREDRGGGRGDRGGREDRPREDRPRRERTGTGGD